MINEALNKINQNIDILQNLTINKNFTDDYQRNQIISKYQILLQRLNTNPNIDIEKALSFLQNIENEANELISKYSKEQIK